MGKIEEHIPQHLIDSFLAEAVEQEQWDSWSPHLEKCDICKKKIDVSKQEREQFIAHNPPAHSIDKIMDKKKSFIPFKIWAPAAGIIAAGIIAILFIGKMEPKITKSVNDQVEDIQLKGTSSSVKISVLRPSNNKTWYLLEDSLLTANDKLTIYVNPPKGLHNIFVFSIKDDGTTQWIFELKVDKSGPLPNELILDKDPNPEKLYIVFADKKLYHDDIKRSLTSNKRHNIQYFSFPINKK